MLGALGHTLQTIRVAGGAGDALGGDSAQQPHALADHCGRMGAWDIYSFSRGHSRFQRGAVCAVWLPAGYRLHIALKTP